MRNSIVCNEILSTTQSLGRLSAWRCVVLGTVCALSIAFRTSPAHTQEPIKIWEFSPYQVEIWYAFEPSVNASEMAKQHWVTQVQADLERTFRAAWNVRMQPLSPALQASVLRDIDNFSIDSLQANELVLVVASEHPSTTTIRTFDAAIDSLTNIGCTADVKRQLEAAVNNMQLAEDETEAHQLNKLVSICQVEAGGQAAIEEKLNQAALAAALIPRWRLAHLAKATRPLVTPLPWQTDARFRDLDKVVFVAIRGEGADTLIQARELDCPMQFLGPAMHDRTDNWPYAARLATTTIARAFAPVARVEDAESRTAELRLRAGGLILDKRNPAAVAIGDVMQPIVRRDDRNGIPTLLEPLSWTYAAITSSDGVKMEANVYTYSGGPGLQGRKNRRTQRMLLKVRPIAEQTEIELLIRDTRQPQSGCLVYRRDLLTDEFELLGRTDWRGRFTVHVPYQAGGVLPEAIRYQRLLAQKEAEAQAAQAAQAVDSNQAADTNPPESPVAATETGNSPAAAASPSETDNKDAQRATQPRPDDKSLSPRADPAVIPLSAPLTLIYIKNGDTVLAKLPLVPGLKAVETAELPDDRRRLKAEGFVRGFQGEILDLIGLRNLLAARIKLHLKNGKNEAAQATLEELRQLKNYNEMADQLEALQRRMLDENIGPISISAKNRIDRMFQTTRDMLQKYLQDNLLSDSERAVSGL